MDPKLARLADYLKINVSPVVSVNFHDMSQHTIYAIWTLSPLDFVQHCQSDSHTARNTSQHHTFEVLRLPRKPNMEYLKCGACYEK